MTHALKNCSVLVVGRHWGGFQDGLIDMSGEGQKYTLFGQFNNLVLVADTNEEFEKREQQKRTMLCAVQVIVWQNMLQAV